MTRLINDRRDLIVQEMIDHRFQSEIASLCDEQTSIALLAYDRAYSKGKRDRMNELPNGWLPQGSTIKVEFSTDTAILNFNGDFSMRYSKNAEIHRSSDPVSRPFPYSDLNSVVTQFEARDGLTIRYNELQGKISKLNESIKIARHTLRATIQNFHTLEKLVEAWPEIEPFVKATARQNETPLHLPVVQVKDLNKLFKLPVV